MRAVRGFTLLELLVATAVVSGLALGAFALVRDARDAFVVDTERADMHQRLRVGAVTLVQSLLDASAVRPYRADGAAADPPGTFKDDTITAVGASPVTFWLKSDDRAGTCQLMSYAGGVAADVPVVDNVVRLTFEYFGDPLPSIEPPGRQLVPLPAAQLTDGPWRPDEFAATRWDADLARVRAVRITLRVQAAAAALRGPANALFARAGTAIDPARWVPDLEAQFQVAPRNLNLGR